MNSNNSIVAHIGQLIRQSAKSPIGGNVACFRYKFGIDVDDNVLKNIRLIIVHGPDKISVPPKVAKL